MRSNDDNLELFADLLEPCAEILGDREFARIMQGEKKIAAIKYAIKNHKQAVVTILALADGVEPGTYKVPSPPVLALKILNLFNDPDIAQLFTPSVTETHSISATANIEEKEN